MVLILLAVVFLLMFGSSKASTITASSRCYYQIPVPLQPETGLAALHVGPVVFHWVASTGLHLRICHHAS